MASILIVDDEPSITIVVGALLAENNHDVTRVVDGQEAKDLIDSDKGFDLAVFDIRMKPIDGMELLAHAHTKRPALKVMMLSAYYSDDIVRKATDLGAVACIAKPFAVEEFIETVEAQLASPKI